LLIASFMQLSWQDNGFRAENLWTGVLRLPAVHYPDNEARARFGERLLQEIRNVPGVESAAIADAVPLEGGSRTYYARPDGNPPPVNQRPIAPNNAVSPGYFRAFGIPLIAGRDIDERDRADRPKVMLISKAGAKKIFPGEGPIGRVLLLGGAQERVEIVGVVGDVRSTQLTQTDDAEFYRPWLQDPSPRFRLAIRGRAAPDEIMRSARTTLTRLDAGLPIFNTATMSDLVVQAIGQQRLMMTLLAVFAGTALLLATVGIYGAVAYTVEQRTGEIGLRMALGAQTQDVLRLVVRQGMNPVILGLIIGLAGTFVVGRLLAAQLYQISPQNPILLCATAIVLAVAGLLACLIPARRATLVDPIEALRTE
jgi:putative ABC transport system permease protein